jgi:beta-alanine degradation protein BauB
MGRLGSKDASQETVHGWADGAVAFGGREGDVPVTTATKGPPMALVTAKAVPTVFIDNERVRVTEWRFAPGAATGWHRHALDYVVVPMADGVLELVGPGGERSRAELKLGVPYFRNAGVEHDVINANAFEFAFVEVELKGGA